MLHTARFSRGPRRRTQIGSFQCNPDVGLPYVAIIEGLKRRHNFIILTERMTKSAAQHDCSGVCCKIKKTTSSLRTSLKKYHGAMGPQTKMHTDKGRPRHSTGVEVIFGSMRVVHLGNENAAAVTQLQKSVIVTIRISGIRKP